MKAIRGLNLDNITHDIRKSLMTDTKLLTSFLTTEKNVWNAMCTLASEQSEAAKILAVWGKNEGEDICDVTEKLSVFLTKLSEAEGMLSDRYGSYRAHIKDIKTRESAMKEPRLKKEALWAKIEKEERKASHSKKPEQHDAKLAEYAKELERAHRESEADEAALADFKRVKLREALLAQLSALYEFTEKVRIITMYGRQIVEQIPVNQTKPGEPRPEYTGKEITEKYVVQGVAALAPWVKAPITSTEARRHAKPQQASPDQPTTTPLRSSSQKHIGPADVLAAKIDPVTSSGPLHEASVGHMGSIKGPVASATTQANTSPVASAPLLPQDQSNSKFVEIVQPDEKVRQVPDRPFLPPRMPAPETLAAHAASIDVHQAMHSQTNERRQQQVIEGPSLQSAPAETTPPQMRPELERSESIERAPMSQESEMAVHQQIADVQLQQVPAEVMPLQVKPEPGQSGLIERAPMQRAASEIAAQGSPQSPSQEVPLQAPPQAQSHAPSQAPSQAPPEAPSQASPEALSQTPSAKDIPEQPSQTSESSEPAVPSAPTEADPPSAEADQHHRESKHVQFSSVEEEIP